MKRKRTEPFWVENHRAICFFKHRNAVVEAELVTLKRKVANLSEELKVITKSGPSRVQNKIERHSMILENMTLKRTIREMRLLRENFKKHITSPLTQDQDL